MSGEPREKESLQFGFDKILFLKKQKGAEFSSVGRYLPLSEHKYSLLEVWALCT